MSQAARTVEGVDLLGFLMRLLVAVVLAVLVAGCSGPAPPVEEVTSSADTDDQSDVAASDEPELDDDLEADPEADVEVAPEPDQEPTPDSEADGEPEDAARRYFDAFATYRAGGMQAMLEEAVEGSPAAVYAEVQIAYVSALQQEGWPQEPAQPRVTDTGIEMCSGDGAGGRACSQFESLQVEGGKLRSFTVDGSDIAERLADGGQIAQQGEAAVELIGAYHSVQADSLIVALDVRNGTDQTLNLNPYSAEYVTADGRQVTASDAFAPIDLRAGVSAYVVVVFPAQGVGGAVYLTGYGEDFSDALEWELQLVPMDG